MPSPDSLVQAVGVSRDNGISNVSVRVTPFILTKEQRGQNIVIEVSIFRDGEIRCGVGVPDGSREGNPRKNTDSGALA